MCELWTQAISLRSHRARVDAMSSFIDPRIMTSALSSVKPGIDITTSMRPFLSSFFVVVGDGLVDSTGLDQLCCSTTGVVIALSVWESNGCSHLSG